MRKFSEIYENVVLTEAKPKLLSEWINQNDYMQLRLDRKIEVGPKEAPYNATTTFISKPWKTNERRLAISWYENYTSVGAVYEIPKGLWKKEVEPAYEHYKKRWGSLNPDGYKNDNDHEMQGAARADFIRGGYKEPSFEDGTIYKAVVKNLHDIKLSEDMILFEPPKLKGLKLIGIYSPEDNIEHFELQKKAEIARQEADAEKKKAWDKAYKAAGSDGMAQYELRWRASHGYGPNDSISGKSPWS